MEEKLSNLYVSNHCNISSKECWNSGISYSDILILMPDSRTVYDLIFTLFILLTLSR